MALATPSQSATPVSTITVSSRDWSRSRVPAFPALPPHPRGRRGGSEPLRVACELGGTQGLVNRVPTSTTSAPWSRVACSRERHPHGHEDGRLDSERAGGERYACAWLPTDAQPLLAFSSSVRRDVSCSAPDLVERCCRFSRVDGEPRTSRGNELSIGVVSIAPDTRSRASGNRRASVPQDGIRHGEGSPSQWGSGWFATHHSR